MRSLVVAIIVFLVLCLAPPSASPQVVGCGANQNGEALECGGYTERVSQTSTNQGERLSNSSAGPTTRYYAYDRLTTGPDGQPCVTTGYAAEGTSPRDHVPDESQSQIEGAGGYNNVFNEYPPCPEQPRAPGQAAPVETRAMTAARYWERVPLPRPQPSIAPGRAITGKLAYLETRGQVTHTYTNDTAFGPLEITATGRYSVDWGDGETSGPHSTEGMPWPDGQITHEYQRVGAYDVVVTERWTATWRLDGESGVLRTLQTTGRIDDFPVQQIQAVILR